MIIGYGRTSTIEQATQFGDDPYSERHKFDPYCGGMVPRGAAAGPDSKSGKTVQPADPNHWLSSNLIAFRGAGLT